MMTINTIFVVCVAQMKKAMGLSTNWTFTDG